MAVREKKAMIMSPRKTIKQIAKELGHVAGCLCSECKNAECMHNPRFWQKYKVVGWPEPQLGEGCQGD